MKEKIKSVFFTTGITYLLVTYCFTYIRSTINSNKSAMLDFDNLTYILLFSFFLGLLGLIFNIKKVPKVVLRLIHLILALGDAFLLLTLCDVVGKAKNVLIGLILFVLIYFIIVGGKAFIKFIFTRRSIEKSEYKNIIK